MKIGDKVRPKYMIPVSNKKNMFEDETGVITNISHDNYGHTIITVQRDKDGEDFEAFDFNWEPA